MDLDAACNCTHGTACSSCASRGSQGERTAFRVRRALRGGRGATSEPCGGMGWATRELGQLDHGSWLALKIALSALQPIGGPLAGLLQFFRSGCDVHQMARNDARDLLVMLPAYRKNRAAVSGALGLVPVGGPIAIAILDGASDPSGPFMVWMRDLGGGSSSSSSSRSAASAARARVGTCRELGYKPNNDKDRNGRNLSSCVSTLKGGVEDYPRAAYGLPPLLTRYRPPARTTSKPAISKKSASAALGIGGAFIGNLIGGWKGALVGLVLGAGGAVVAASDDESEG